MPKTKDSRADDIDRVKAAHKACLIVLDEGFTFVRNVMHSCPPLLQNLKAGENRFEGVPGRLAVKGAVQLLGEVRSLDNKCEAARLAVLPVDGVMAEVSTILTDSVESDQTSYHQFAVSTAYGPIGTFDWWFFQGEKENNDVGLETPMWRDHPTDEVVSWLVERDWTKLPSEFARDVNASVIGVRPDWRLPAQLYVEHMRARRLVSRHGLMPDTHTDNVNETPRRSIMQVARVREAIKALEAEGIKRPKPIQIVQRARVRHQDSWAILRKIGYINGSKSQHEST